MVRHAVRLCILIGGFFVTACDTAGDTVSVTIDMRCATSADCPARFTCESDDEHGPPTTMCESSDPQARCPAEFDTKIGHGQTFCMPRASTSITVRERARDVRGSDR